MNKDALHRKLIRLGDLMGDGLHNEQGGSWIEDEYIYTLQDLGLAPKKKRKCRLERIDEAMAERVLLVECTECGGALQQTRSGSMTAKCVGCGLKFKLLK